MHAYMQGATVNLRLVLQKQTHVPCVSNRSGIALSDTQQIKVFLATCQAG